MVKVEGMWKKYTAEFTKYVNDALEQYEIKAAKAVFVGYFTNAIFQIVAEDGIKYALRIASPGWRTYTDLKSEALWLHDISKGSDIGSPVPVISKTGRYLTAIADSDGQMRYCLLMSWLEGKKFQDNLNSDNLFKMGELFARLHNFSAGYEPPLGFTKRRMDQIFAREEKVVLFLKKNRKYFTPEQYEVIQAVKDRTDSAYERLYKDPSGLMVISHDLHHENIILDDTGKLRPFDFEDTSLGYPVQDIAMAMRDLMESVPEQFDKYLKDLRKGYETLRKWPEKYKGQIDDFMAGRMLWVANWVLINEKEEFEKHIKWAVSKLEQYVKTGKLRY